MVCHTSTGKAGSALSTNPCGPTQGQAVQVGEQLLQTEQQLVTQRALQRLRRLPTEQGTGYLRL